ncbi:unnamed protein product, partial [Darwinula stevensoni]
MSLGLLQQEMSSGQRQYLVCSLAVLLSNLLLVNIACGSGDFFREDLLIKPLSDGHVYSAFRFLISRDFPSSANASGSHFNLFPRALGEIIQASQVEELHLSLTQGLWRHWKWGYPIRDAPPGAEVWAYFGEEVLDVDKHWKDLNNALAGLFCASLDSIKPDKSVNPQLNFVPSSSNPDMSKLRYAALPRETVCTENMTPWMKLLPCLGKRGLSSLLTAVKLFDTSLHSIAVDLRPICTGETCRQELVLTLSTVTAHPEITWSLKKIFGVGLFSACPIADDSIIYVDLAHNVTLKFDLNPSPTTVNASYAVYDLQTFSFNEPLNLAAVPSVKKSILDRTPRLPPIHSHRFLTGIGMERGGITTNLHNNLYNQELSVSVMQSIPWFLHVSLHTLTFKINGKDTTPLYLGFVPGKDRRRPNLLEVAIKLPPKSIGTLSIQFEKSFLKWTEYPPDANHGFYVPSAVVTATLPSFRNRTTLPCEELPSKMMRFYTESLLVSLPTPDFSMPYNVICLTCTVVALAFGPLHNITTKRLVLVPNDELKKGLLQRMLNCLRSRKIEVPSKTESEERVMKEKKEKAHMDWSEENGPKKETPPQDVGGREEEENGRDQGETNCEVEGESENSGFLFKQGSTSRVDVDMVFYSEVYHYLTQGVFPEACTEVAKRNIKKNASSTHVPARKMQRQISRNYYWRGYFVDLVRYVRDCEVCAEEESHKRTRLASVLSQYNKENVPPEQTGVLDRLAKVWKKIEVRIYGPYSKTVHENEYIIAMVDPFSRWISAQAIPATTHGVRTADYLFETFCTLGFAQCCMVGFSSELFETMQVRYRERFDQMRDTFTELGHPFESEESQQSFLFTLQENSTLCSWAEDMMDTFANGHPSTWDEELDKFLFQYRTQKSSELHQSPFYMMFGRNPTGFISTEDQVKLAQLNHELEEQVPSNRRRLQSSTLQCRHCSQIFTSKISFRIHQRKHTEEARRRGMLEGELPCSWGSAQDAARRMYLKRRKANIARASKHHAYLSSSSEGIPTGEKRKELTQTTICAVKALLATATKRRPKRGKYQRYSAELRDEVAEYAVTHGILEAVKVYSERLGSSISESTVRNFVRFHRHFTPQVKEEIGKYAHEHGIEAALKQYEEKLGGRFCKGLVAKFKKYYISLHPELNPGGSGRKEGGGGLNSVTLDPSKVKKFFTTTEKDLIGQYALQHGVMATIDHFWQKSRWYLKESVVRKFRKAFQEKKGMQEMTVMQGHGHGGQHHMSTATILQQDGFPASITIGDLNMSQPNQGMDILQTSLHVLNSPISSTTSNASGMLYGQGYPGQMVNLHAFGNPQTPSNAMQNPQLQAHIFALTPLSEPGVNVNVSTADLNAPGQTQHHIPVQVTYVPQYQGNHGGQQPPPSQQSQQTQVISTSLSFETAGPSMSIREVGHNQEQQETQPELTQEVVVREEQSNSIVMLHTPKPMGPGSSGETLDKVPDAGETLSSVSEPSSTQTPKTVLEKSAKGGKRSKRPIQGSIRGKYTQYPPEIRAEVGRYALEHGSMETMVHFKEAYGLEIPESTIRGLRDKYLSQQTQEMSEVTELERLPRGRPTRLGKYDELVQDCIREMMKNGEKVSTLVVIATAKQILMQYEPHVLEEHGGPVMLNPTWAKSFLKHLCEACASWERDLKTQERVGRKRKISLKFDTDGCVAGDEGDDDCDAGESDGNGDPGIPDQYCSLLACCSRSATQVSGRENEVPVDVAEFPIGEVSSDGDVDPE